MKRIPHQFELLDHVVTVRQVKESDWEEVAAKHDSTITDEQEARMAESDGYFLPSQKLVLVCKRGVPSYRFQMFCHELTHAILDSMNSDLSYDEIFVDNFAGLLAQALKSAK